MEKVSNEYQYEYCTSLYVSDLPNVTKKYCTNKILLGTVQYSTRHVLAISHVVICGGIFLLLLFLCTFMIYPM